MASTMLRARIRPLHPVAVRKPSPAQDRDYHPVMQSPGDVICNLLLGIASTVIGVLIVYWIFMPHIRLGYRVHDADSGRRFHCSYRNTGFLGVHDVKVRVWIALELQVGRLIFVEVPVDDAERPVLDRRGKSRWQKPRLLLDKADWSQLPSEPTDMTALREILGDSRTELVLTVSATTNIAQITRVKRKAYRQAEVSSERGCP